ncbi:MAG TPA: hypothetical protein H9805_12630 [Candidatus Janibacter merdipullorum]|nr:hypothetical protein [Candidatus Janibacter merdipullorum]
MGARVGWIVVGLVLVVAAALVWAAVGWQSGGVSESPPTHAVRSECPDEMPTGDTGVTVPEGAASDDRAHLVPDGTPVGIQVCGYATDEGADSSPGRLIGSTDLAGDLDRVVARLREVPPMRGMTQASCAMRSPRTPYLLVVDYGESSAWIAAEYTPDCDYASRYTTNGTHRFERIGEELNEAYAEGRWPHG